MSHLVAITGATGNIGHALAEGLLRQEHRVRAIGRQQDRLAPLVALGAEARAGDLLDNDFLTEALRGVDAVFAMIPPNYTAPDIREFQGNVGGSIARALKRVGLPPTVALSSIGAGLPSGVGVVTGLHEFEETLKSMKGLPLTILRPAFFMENHLGSIESIHSRGMNSSPMWADAMLPMIATRDIASVAIEILAHPTFTGQSIVDLLGPRDYSYRETTTILGRAIGLPNLKYQPASYEDFRKQLAGMGVSAKTADTFVEMYDAFNSGRVARTLRRTPENTTPTTLEQFALEVFAPAYERGIRRAA